MPREPQEQLPEEFPDDFRAWADDPANVEAVDMLVAHFVAEDGVEMVTDLLGCQGQQHQWTAERWMDKLRDQFKGWWDRGRPRLKAKNVSITYWTPQLERDAQSLLGSNLPPGAGFGLTRRWRKLAGGTIEPDGWEAGVQDGPASAMGRGESPVAAARAALDAWREFVSGARVDLSALAPSAESNDAPAPADVRPPPLNAPSAGKSAAGDDAGRAAG